MKKDIILPIIIILIAIGGGAYLLKSPNQQGVAQEQIQASELRKVDLQIENMFCIGCRSSVVNSVMAYDGVIQADADVGSGTGWVIYDPEVITKEEIVGLPIFDAYTASVVADEAYSGSTAKVVDGEIPEDVEEKLNRLAELLQEKDIEMESFFQEELDEAIEGGYWDKANNLLDNYIEAYEQG